MLRPFEVPGRFGRSLLLLLFRCRVQESVSLDDQQALDDEDFFGLSLSLRAQALCRPGRFSHDSIRQLIRCANRRQLLFSAEMPRVGESVAEFSAAYPLPLVRSLAAGSLEASKGSAKVVPFTSVASECPSLREMVALVQNDEAAPPWPVRLTMIQSGLVSCLTAWGLRKLFGTGSGKQVT